MSLTSGVFLAIVAFFTWRGYQKGFLGSITKLLSFVIAYPAAIFLTKPFANLLRGFTNLDGLMLFLVAGCSIFLIASLVVSLVLGGIAKLVPHHPPMLAPLPQLQAIPGQVDEPAVLHRAPVGRLRADIPPNFHRSLGVGVPLGGKAPVGVAERQPTNHHIVHTTMARRVPLEFQKMIQEIQA